ncbi:effector-associated constant component EACC1 [Actinokineospora enzanensis]|uniref:effector-associated constant component EACC1 n=1 Tax=Actinokineospora enzanensis TaxID=155975 RepID=UPI00036A2EF7|nr:hypothetical protein [Actinokineospora enzanensis]
MDILVTPITADPRDADALADIAAWLRLEDELRGRIDLRSAPPRPGEMGSLWEVLVVAAGAGGAVTVLVQSLFGWLQSKRRDLSIRLTIGGDELVLDAKQLNADPAAVLRLTTAAIEAMQRAQQAHGAPGRIEGRPDAAG